MARALLASLVQSGDLGPQKLQTSLWAPDFACRRHPFVVIFRRVCFRFGANAYVVPVERLLLVSVPKLIRESPTPSTRNVNMKKAARFLLAISLVSLAWGQQSSSSTSIVPTVIHFSGNLSDLATKPATNIVGVTFSLYSDQQGGSPLWLETQNVRVDANGHYVVTLGSTTSQGLPSNIFASGEARWLGVQAQGQSEQPRVLLVSVPYALKAGDAETVGGLPPSAFMLATPNGSTAQSAHLPAAASTTPPRHSGAPARKTSSHSGPITPAISATPFSFNPDLRMSESALLRLPAPSTSTAV